MARSLDGLIHHLLDQIALCGEYGALPSEFIAHVSNYYEIAKEAANIAENEPGAPTTSSTPNVDRPFLERVWKWLTARPEIRLGNHPSHKRLTLSEAEARNAAIGGSKCFQPVSQSLQQNPIGATSLEPESFDNIHNGLDVQHPKLAISADTTSLHEVSKETAKNHVTHPTDVHHVQPDKASAGRRASKKPTKATKASTQESEIRLFASENRMWHALTGHGPDTQKIKPLEFACLSGIAASGVDGIYQSDLVKRTGQDKRSIPLRTDRLFESGYIQKKRVTIQLFDSKRLLHTSHLLHKRFAKDILDQTDGPIQSNTAGAVDDDNSGTTDPHEVKHPEHLDPTNQSREEARKIERPVPIWTPDRLLGNQIFDLVDRSGSKGMSVNDIRDNLLSEYVRRPTVEFVTRLCECWQMSQPLHLRHLSIIRDTVLKGRGSVFNYYTYRNFTKLVEKGTGFWEAVLDVPDDLTAGTNFAASLDAVPTLDDHGFSAIDAKLFCGAANEATVEDCVSMLKSRTLFPHWKHNRKPLKSIDDTHDNQQSPYNAKVLANQKASLKSNLLQPDRPVKPRGRPRKKYSANPLKHQRSLKHAERYVRNKMEKEIAQRVDNGEDATSVAARVLDEFEKYNKEMGQDPLSAYTRGVILHKFAGGPDPRPLKIQENAQEQPRVTSIWPSMAAHTILVPKSPEKVLTGPKKRSKPKRKPLEIQENAQERPKVTSIWPSMAAHTILVPKSPEKALTGPKKRSKPKTEVDNPLKRARQSHVDLPDSTIEADTQLAKNPVKRARQTYVHLPESTIEVDTQPAKNPVKRARQSDGCLPELSIEADTQPAKKKLRRTVDAVHSIPETTIEADTQPAEKKPQHTVDAIHTTLEPYWPSVAAHSCPYFPPPSLSRTAVPEKVKRKRGRPKKEVYPQAVREAHSDGNLHYLPSIFAHSGSFLASKSLPITQSHQEKEDGKLPVERECVLASPTDLTYMEGLRYSPIAAAHSSAFTPVNVHPPAQATRTRINRMKTTASSRARMSPTSLTSPTPEVSRESLSLHAGPYPDGFYPGWVQYMSKYYEESLKSVPREHDGVYVSDTKNRRKRHKEPQGFRPEFYKVVVIKFERLCELPWFNGTDKMLPQTTSALTETPSSHDIPDLVTCPPNAQEIDVPPAPSQSPSATGSSSQLEKASVCIPRNTGTSPPYTQSSLANIFQHQPRTTDVFSYSAANENKSKDDGKKVHHRPLSPHTLATGAHSARADSRHILLPQTSETLLDIQQDARPALEVTDVAKSPDALCYQPAQELPLNVGSADPAFEEAPPGPRRENTTINHASSPVVEFPATASKNSDASIIIGEVAPLEERAEIFPIVSKTPVTPAQASKDNETSSAIGGTNFARHAEPIETPPTSISNSMAETQSVGNGGSSFASPGTRQTPHLSGSPYANPAVLTLPKVDYPQSPSHSQPNIIKLNRKPARKTVGNMNRQGGSVAILRKKVVMEIVDQCGGVYPGHRELVKAFVIEWEKKGLEGGTPDEKTMQSTVNVLHKDGKLRQIYFFFEDKKGLRVKKDMLLYPSIDLMDPRVKDLQKRMIAYYPRSYWPSAVVPPDDYTFNTKRMMEGKDRVKEAKYEALKDQELALLEQRAQDGMEQGGPAENAHAESEQLLRVPSIPKMTPSHAHRQPRVSKPKRRKPASLKRAFGRGTSLLAALLEPSPPPPSSQELLWLPEKYAFSELNYEEERPTVLEPTIRENNRRRHARYGARIKDLRPSHSLSPLVPMQFRSPLSVSQSSTRYGRSLGSQAQYSHCSPDDIGRDGRQSTSIADSLEPSESGPGVTWLATEQIEDFQPQPKQLVVNFMDAVHYFHQTSGTFSVGFLGIAPPRKVSRDLGTCSKPYSHGPRAIHPEFPSQRGPRRLMPTRSLEDQGTEFEKEVDDLLRLELELTGLEHANFGHSTFINHVFSHAHTTVQAADADMNLMKGINVPSDGGRIIHKRIRPEISDGLRFSSKRSRSMAFVHAGAPENFKRRRLNMLTEGTAQGKSPKTPRPDPDGKIRRIRGPRSTLHIDDERRLVIAVLIVRTLTGGLNKRVDWVLVNRIFGSIYEPDFPFKRWSYLRFKFRHVIPGMEANFQEQFAKAYEEGSVPVLDFEKLPEYDWQWLFEWTLERLGQSHQSQPDLPAERAQFDDQYALKDSSQIDINDYYEINTKESTTVAKREDMLTNISYVYPIHNRVLDNESQSKDSIAVAKSWIRANSIALSDTYRPDDASLKLGTLPDKVLHDALGQLLSDKVLWQENKGRIIPGRNYYINELCMARLQRNILSPSFQQAVAFKHDLDEEFKEKGSAVHPYTADNGHMLAMMDLVAHQRISLVPTNVPLNEWGQADSYEIRTMDKSRLNFQVNLQPLPSYIYGNPLEPLPAPPNQHLQDPMARIPLWYDIDGEFVPAMWDLALAVVMAILAVRTGVGAEEIEKVTKPAMEAWEIELVLGWLVDAKAAVKVGCGYVLEEWWWMALPGDEVSEQLDLPTLDEDLMEVDETSDDRTPNIGRRLEVIIEEPTEVHDLSDHRTPNGGITPVKEASKPSQLDTPGVNEDAMQVDGISNDRTLHTGKELEAGIEEPAEAQHDGVERAPNADKEPEKGAPEPSQLDLPAINEDPIEVDEISGGPTPDTAKKPEAVTEEPMETHKTNDKRTPDTDRTPGTNPPASSQLPDRLFTDFRARPIIPSNADSPMDNG